MYRIQELMHPIKAHEFFGVCHEMPPVITPIFKFILNLKIPPLCHSRQLACSKHCMPKVNQPMKTQQDQEVALSQDAYDTGNCVSADQYIVNTPGQLLLDYGRDARGTTQSVSWWYTLS